MPPLKVWAPYERLLAGDLNNAMRYAAGEGAIVGASCKVVGTTVPNTVANTRTEVPLGAPAAGSDPLGFYNPATKRVKCPVGLAGVYLFTGGVNMTSGSTSSSPNVAHLDLMGVAGYTALALGTFMAFTTSSPLGLHASVIMPMADGEEWWLGVTSRTVAGTNAFVPMWQIVRLAPYLGAIGS